MEGGDHEVFAVSIDQLIRNDGNMIIADESEVDEHRAIERTSLDLETTSSSNYIPNLSSQ